MPYPLLRVGNLSSALIERVPSRLRKRLLRFRELTICPALWKMRCGVSSSIYGAAFHCSIATSRRCWLEAGRETFSVG